MRMSRERVNGSRASRHVTCVGTTLGPSLHTCHAGLITPPFARCANMAQFVLRSITPYTCAFVDINRGAAKVMSYHDSRMARRDEQQPTYACKPAGEDKIRRQTYFILNRVPLAVGVLSIWVPAQIYRPGALDLLVKGSPW